jgi:hypothetical protein
MIGRWQRTRSQSGGEGWSGGSEYLTYGAAAAAAVARGVSSRRRSMRIAGQKRHPTRGGQGQQVVSGRTNVGQDKGRGARRR